MIAGNAIITIILIAMIGSGALYVYGKQKIEAPGPLQEDKVVNIPARAGVTDIADILLREGESESAVNLAVYREGQRLRQHEPYRTLLGHFRHEIGHYYWDRLIQNSSGLNSARPIYSPTV